MKRTTAVLAAVFAAAASLAIAQQQPYFETFEVRLHNLEVVVTDAKGNPVRGLTKDDFVVLEDGKPQSITNFSTYDARSSSVAGSSVPRSDGAATPVAEKPAPRRFLFFVDDMGIQKNALSTLVANARGIVDEMKDGDVAAVIRPTGEDRIAQDFTSDREAVRKALLEAIESCKLTSTSPGFQELREFRNQMENADSEVEGNFSKGVYISRTRERVRQRLSQLRALVGSMAGVEGRKVLVMITSGLPSNPGRDAIEFEAQMAPGNDKLVTEWGERGSDFTALVDELSRTAAAHGVTIYALEPEVPVSVGVSTKNAASRTVGTNGNVRGIQFDPKRGLPSGTYHVTGSTVLPPGMLEEYLHYRTRTLDSMTEKTGGKWFRGVGAIDDVFRQVASDLSVYYSLAYRATGEANRPRRVEVRVKSRPELRVRTRSEVVDRSIEREMGDLTAANLLFPRALNELRIDVKSGQPVAAGGKAVNVPLDIVIPLDTLTFTQTNDGTYAATFDLHYAVSGTRNNFTTSGKHRQNLTINAQQYASRGATPYHFKTGIQIPTGAARIAIGVMDAASHLSGFTNVDVTAP